MVVATASRIDRAWRALERVMDPEVPVVSVVDLGIVREITEGQDSIRVSIVPTYSGCPAMAFITEAIIDALAKAGLEPATVQVTHGPAWSTDWITPLGRARLKEFGIAPPGPSATQVVRFAAPAVACPRCASRDTERVAEFGSTACKAHYRCRACLEPFDYFKAI